MKTAATIITLGLYVGLYYILGFLPFPSPNNPGCIIFLGFIFFGWKFMYKTSEFLIGIFIKIDPKYVKKQISKELSDVYSDSAYIIHSGAINDAVYKIEKIISKKTE